MKRLGAGVALVLAALIGVSATATAGTLTLQTRDGGYVSVQDFTAGLASSRIGPSVYYQLTHNQDTQGSRAQFDITFGLTDSSISIGLFKHPLRKSRLAAERALRRFFPLSNAALCRLKTAVSVPFSIDADYSGRELGLSFCPGAVRLR